MRPEIRIRSPRFACVSDNGLSDILDATVDNTIIQAFVVILVIFL